MKVLVTGFTPFNNEINNYSSEVLKYIDNVDKVILDVLYDECYLILDNSTNLNEYDLIIALGEARSRNELTLELRAKNVSSCSLKDNLGVLKNDEVISANANEFLYTKVDVSKVKDDIIFSNDAGKFVCNNLYFHLLENHPDKAIFIHIPNCHNAEKEYIRYACIINQIINKLLSDSNMFKD